MGYEFVEVETSNHITALRLNRPDALNAFNWTQMLDLIEALHDAHEDDDVFCVVLTGNGRAFSSGDLPPEKWSKPKVSI